jgi:hypothetical protein
MSQCNHVAAKFSFDNTRSGKMPNGRCKLRERLMHNKNAIFKRFISGFWIDQAAIRSGYDVEDAFVKINC